MGSQSCRNRSVHQKPTSSTPWSTNPKHRFEIPSNSKRIRLDPIIYTLYIYKYIYIHIIYYIYKYKSHRKCHSHSTPSIPHKLTKYHLSLSEVPLNNPKKSVQSLSNHHKSDRITINRRKYSCISTSFV